METLLIQAFVTIVCAAITGLPAILYARKSLLQGQANGQKADAASVKVDLATVKLDHATYNAEVAASLAKDNNAKTDEVIAGNVKIHELVNSGSDKMKLEIAALKAELLRANDRTDKLAATIDQLLHAKATATLDPGEGAAAIKVEVVNTPLATKETV